MQLKLYPKYKDSGIQWIGEIPEGWEVHKLKRISKIETGNTPSKEDDRYYINGIFPWIRPDELKEFKPIEASNFYLNEEGKLLARMIPKGSILVCCIGSLGKIGIAGVDLATNQQINSVIPNQNKFNPNFARYIIYASQPEYERIGNANVVAILSKNQQGEFFYCLPNIDEQQKIASFLNKKTAKVDVLIEKDNKLIMLLKEKRTALINHAVTEGLDPNVKLKDSGISWIGKIPEGWEVRKLKQVTSIMISNVDKKSKPNEEEVLLCNYNEVYNNEFITSDLSFMNATASIEQINKFSIKKGDVIITKDSESPKDIAVPSLVKENLDNIICGYHLALIRPNKSKIKGKYLLRIFQSRKINDQFVISANGVTRFGISTYPIKNSLVIIPPLQEQTAIANFLDKATSKIDKTIEKIEKKIALLGEYKKSLIHHAVTGKIDVREAVA